MVMVITQNLLTFVPQLFIEDLSNQQESYLYLSGVIHVFSQINLSLPGTAIGPLVYQVSLVSCLASWTLSGAVVLH